MQRIAHIIDGKIANVSLLADGTPIPEGAMLESDAIAKGMFWIERPTPIPQSAQMWQVKVWMVRKGINLASIPQIIAAQIPEGAQRDEALVRWEHTTEVPFDNALVGLVADGLNVEKQTAWEEILAI